jgi:hypothetical protein
MLLLAITPYGDIARPCLQQRICDPLYAGRV